MFNQHSAPLKNLVSKDGVAAISEAGFEAGKKAAFIADAAAKSLFSFAAAGIKTLTETAAAGTGQPIKLNKFTVTVKRLLAEGGFGSVYIVSNAAARGDFALKKLNCQSREQVEEASEELAALQRFSGADNIIRLLDYATLKSTGGTVIYMLFPLYDVGTTWDLIEAAADERAAWPFPEARALHILRGVCRGLDAMHQAGVAHRDIKPHNILLDHESNAVIMDLGSVTKARVVVTSRRQASILQEDAAVKASAPYRCPELTETPSEINIDERIDIWSLGCTAYCLAFGNSPFESPREGVLRLAILNGKYKTPAPLRNRDCAFSQRFMDLIQSMLQVDHTQRPFARDLFSMCEGL